MNSIALDPHVLTWNIGQMKSFALLLILSLLAGCSTLTSNQKYKALVREKAASAQLRELEKQFIPSINVDDVALVSILSSIESTCSDLPGGRLKIIDPKNEISQKRVSLHAKDISVAQAHDLLCAQAGAVWWIDQHVYISTKE
jgi:hypothetical protein